MAVSRSRPRPSPPKGASAAGPHPVWSSITPENYREDPLFSRIERAVLSILVSSKVVAPVDVLVGMGALRTEDLNLAASSAAYVRWGKGPRPPLRFTKTGEAKLEGLYARHFVWPGKGPFHLPTRPKATTTKGTDG